MMMLDVIKKGISSVNANVQEARRFASGDPTLAHEAQPRDSHPWMTASCSAPVDIMERPHAVAITQYDYTTAAIYEIPINFTFFFREKRKTTLRWI